MRIAFDGTTLTPGRTGVGYYTDHLLHHLALEVQASGDEIVVVTNAEVHTAQPLPAYVRVHERHRFPVRLAWMQMQASRALRAIRADVAHFTNGIIPLTAPVPTIVTVHDMSLRLYPSCHPLRRLVLNRPLMRAAIDRAAAIVTVSHSARRDLLRLHAVDPDRISVIHEAASPMFRPVRDAARLDDVRRRHGLPARFVLYVGTIEPRKNLPRLMEAFACARRGGLTHDLVCVGPYGWASRDLAGRVDRLDLTRHVHFTGYVPFGDLAAIYSLADLFVFPSLYEGFGLPVVEAMACGTPVVTSNASSLAEIAGPDALTVDPTSVEAIADAIGLLARDADLRAVLSQRGLARARTFSWQQAARELLAVYRRAAGVATVAPDARDTTPTAVASGLTRESWR